MTKYLKKHMHFSGSKIKGVPRMREQCEVERKVNNKSQDRKNNKYIN